MLPWIASAITVTLLALGNGAVATETSEAPDQKLGVTAQPKVAIFAFEETCSEKLQAYITAKGMQGNNLFRKTDRIYFETVTGCVVEETNAVAETTGLYAQEFFPGLNYFGYEVVEAYPTSQGGSFGSIPSWTVMVILEYEINEDSDWGLCGRFEGDSYMFGDRSADWSEPAWAAYAAVEYPRGRSADFNGWPGTHYFMARNAISIVKEITVSDQQGPVVDETVWACGTDTIFQNSEDHGYHQIHTRFYLDPADLAEYEIPFYSWMGW